VDGGDALNGGFQKMDAFHLKGCRDGVIPFCCMANLSLTRTNRNKIRNPKHKI
jgi:hypothetical protein